MKLKELRRIVFSQEPIWNPFCAEQSSSQPLHSSFDPLQTPLCDFSPVWSRVLTPQNKGGKICHLTRGLLTFIYAFCFPGTLCAFDNWHFLKMTLFQCSCKGNILNMSNKPLHSFGGFFWAFSLCGRHVRVKLSQTLCLPCASNFSSNLYHCRKIQGLKFIQQHFVVLFAPGKGGKIWIPCSLRIVLKHISLWLEITSDNQCSQFQDR